MPTNARASTKLSAAIPGKMIGANRQFRNVKTCQTSNATTSASARANGRSGLASPSSGATTHPRRYATGASASPPSQTMPNSYASKIGATKARQGSGRGLTAQ